MSEQHSDPDPDIGEDGSSYAALANVFKEQGNEAFKDGDFEKAVKLYSQGIDIDPDNEFLFSNRSAAYLKSDFKSLALYDAEKCIKICEIKKKPWDKAFNRLGAAQQSLGRFEAAIESFKRAAELVPGNKSHWSNLSSCQAAQESRKKSDLAAAALERQRKEAMEVNKKSKEELDADLLDSFFSDIAPTSVFDTNNNVGFNHKIHPSWNNSTDLDRSDGNNNNESQSEGYDPILGDFFAELQPNNGAVAVEAHDVSKEASISKYMSADLGSGVDQVKRLMRNNYKWYNLNPFYVLQLEIDATEEDIKNRYRKLSSKVHPDKLFGVENAREAFEQVKAAYQRLMDPDQRATLIRNIEFVTSDLKKDRKKMILRGIEESSLPPLDEMIEKAIMKLFADIELQKKRSETLLHMYNSREKGTIHADEDLCAKMAERDKIFNEESRREKRVDDWRSFQSDSTAKRAKS